ncbi:hypothetical protein GGI35DRAFT_491555 [Trichoderma velutinum]
MEDTSIEITSGKRKRVRPRKYFTHKAKAAADVKRKRAARQDASHAQGNIVHTSFYQPVKSLQAADVSNGFHMLADSTNIPPPEERNISQFLTAVDYQLEEGVEAQPEDDERGLVERVAQKLAEQLTRFQGCCNDCHQTAKERRMQSPAEQISLAQYLESTAGLGADVLSSKTLASGKDGLARKVNAECRKKIFCGVDFESEAPLICLDKDERVSRTAGVTFDVDSIIGFPSSLCVAKRGIRWSPTRMTVSDLQSDLHLRSFSVTYFDADGVQRQAHRPVHQVPHYTFGRKSSKIRNEDFQLWMDGILLPAIYRCYSSDQVQHYPSSYNHSQYNSTARGVESLTQHVHPMAREQQLVYCLPPESLGEVWASILSATQEPGFHQFQNVTILLQAKNLKTITKDVTWEKMNLRFEDYWTNAIDESHIAADLYIDIGKETCPRQASRVTPLNQPAAEEDNDLGEAEAETLLYKRCCLESYTSWAAGSLPDEESKKQVFYPFTMLRDSGSLTIETGKRSEQRSAGLLYSQFYPSVKEVFAAGNVYPFTNAAIETLALDKKLRKTWELVGGGLSHQPVALVKAYLYTKLRCHFASLGSMHKSFGIREEHRVSRDLLRAISRHIRSRELHDQHLTAPTEDDSPYYSFNGYGGTFQDPHFVTWEHTRVMLMFLRCLQFSYAGGLIKKVGGCWQDVRLQPDPHQPNGLRRWEGLGFRRTMETYGYAWFLDKVDWSTFTFRQPHAAYMMFNNPSMQTAYRARYHQVRDVRIDFIRVNKAYQWMLEFSAVPACLDLLGDYLRELCLCAFRKDVFFHIKAVLKPECTKAALAGEIPLCYNSVKDSLLKEHQFLQLAAGNRLAVKDIHVLFAWLWKSKDDQFERQGWNDKPFRMLFQQSFHAIKTARGKDRARKWQQELKRSFLGSHWLIPYPHSRGFMRKDKEEKQFIWWPSVHDGLIKHYSKSHGIGTLRHPLPASNVKLHPVSGWKLATTFQKNGYMPYVIQPEQELIQMPESDLYTRLVGFREQTVTGSSQISPTAPMLEVDNCLQGEYYPSKWCDIRQMRIAKTYEECDELNECLWFLKKELQAYENLQSHQPTRYKRRRKRTTTYLDSDSDSVIESDEAEVTSDEESLAIMRGKKAPIIQKMNAQVRKLIGEFNKRYPKWQKSYDPEIRELNYRLEKAGLI